MLKSAYFRFFLVFSLCFFQAESFSSEEELPTIHSYAELLASHQKGTFYVLDLDMTVFRPTTFPSSEPWFKDFFGGLGYHIADPRWVNIIMKSWEHIYQNSDFVFVDSDFAEFVEKVGSENIIGLTARNPKYLIPITKQTFADLKISFQPESRLYAQARNKSPFPEDEGVFWDREVNVIFVGDYNKGLIVEELSRSLKKSKVDRIVFLDDGVHNVHNVHEAARSIDTPVESYHFLGAEDYIRRYHHEYAPDFDPVVFARDNILNGELAEQFQKDHPEEMAFLQKVLSECESKL